MNMTPANTTSARRRLLDTAARLFYREGIHAVGIDRIIAEAGVAKATFYHHFPSKEELVVAYVRQQDELSRVAVDALSGGAPKEAIAAILGRIAETGRDAGYRGCPFLNAAAEYPDAGNPVRRAIDDYRTWYRAHLARLCEQAGTAEPAATARLLIALSDGLLESAYLDGTADLAALIRDGVERLLATRQPRVRHL